MIKVGQRVRINPFKFMRSGPGLSFLYKTMIGKVVFIHPEHRWFTVEYGKPAQRVSYKFSDIGDDVKLISNKEPVS